MTKYHIKKNGEKAICNAKVRACPRGGASQHFESIEDCEKALDIMNERTSKNQFAIARVGNKIVISEDSKKAIRDLTTSQLNIEKLDNTIKKAKDTIKEVFEEMGIKKVSTEYANMTVVGSSQKKSVDVDKLKEAGIYDDYLKESERSGYLSFKIIDDEDGSKRRSLTDPGDFDVPFTKEDVIVNDNGEVTLSERGLKLIKNLRDMDANLKEVKAKQSELKDDLKEVMNDEELPGIKFGGSCWNNFPDTIAKIVDSQALKDDGIYEDYIKTVETKSSIRFKWA